MSAYSRDPDLHCENQELKRIVCQGELEIANLQVENARLQAEKNRRIYYQDIVYRVCSVLDRVFGNSPGSGTICGTADQPSNEVQVRMTAFAETFARLQAEVERLTGIVAASELAMKELSSWLGFGGMSDDSAWTSEKVRAYKQRIIEAVEYNDELIDDACTCTRRLDGPPTEEGWYWQVSTNWIYPTMCREIRQADIDAGWVGELPNGVTMYGPICKPMEA